MILRVTGSCIKLSIGQDTITNVSNYVLSSARLANYVTTS